jgi:hypothetical protein
MTNEFDHLVKSVSLVLEDVPGTVTEPISDEQVPAAPTDQIPSAIPAPTEEKLPVKTERLIQLSLRLLDVISSLDIPDSMRHQILDVEKIPVSAENIDKIQARLEQIADAGIGGFPKESE